MPVFTSAALDSELGGIALMRAVLQVPEQAEPTRTKPAPSWGSPAAALKPSRPARRRGASRSGNRQAATRPVCLA